MGQIKNVICLFLIFSIIVSLLVACKNHLDAKYEYHDCGLDTFEIHDFDSSVNDTIIRKLAMPGIISIDSMEMFIGYGFNHDHLSIFQNNEKIFSGFVKSEGHSDLADCFKCRLVRDAKYRIIVNAYKTADVIIHESYRYILIGYDKGGGLVDIECSTCPLLFD